MFRNFCSVVVSAVSFVSTSISTCVSKLKDGVCGVAALGVLAFNSLCFSAFAQTGTEIEITPSNINWAGVPTQILSALTTPIIVGIGIALSIWVIFAGVQFFRRSSRA